MQAPKIIFMSTILCLFGLLACGGSESGGENPNLGTQSAEFPAGDKAMSSLNTDEQVAFCTYMVGIQGGPGEYQCDESLSMTVPDVDECLAQDFSTEFGSCTVSVVEACFSAISDDPCQLFSNPACEPMFACTWGQ